MNVINMCNTYFLVIGTVLNLFLFSCNSNSPSLETDLTEFNYGTENDSARYYFFKGWEEIMDNGRWTESEIAFRKAIKHDPQWLLGESLVGGITRNTKERQNFLRELELAKDQSSVDERLLLDVNILSLIATNNR
ncbi:MAG: hypothetical protein AAFO07_25725, partial [Bacteroidota bacterium]